MPDTGSGTMVAGPSNEEVLVMATHQFSSGNKLDVKLLDRVVMIMNKTHGDEQRAANEILISLKESPDSWMKVDAILEFSELMESKYFALQILEGLVKFRWKIIPLQQRDAIKSFIVHKILVCCSGRSCSTAQNLLLQKLNIVLIEIVKQDWPLEWPTFISEMMESAASSEAICANNLKILSLLSEDVFDFGKQTLIQVKEAALKNKLFQQVEQIFELCLKILQHKNGDDELVLSCLGLIERFVSWIKPSIVFHNEIPQLLCENFLSGESTRTATLRCLSAFAKISVNEQNQQHEEQLKLMFHMTMKELAHILKESSELRTIYTNGGDNERQFVYEVASFLSSFLKERIELVEVVAPEHDGDIYCTQLHGYAMEILLSISTIDDVELFKICLEFWSTLCKKLFLEEVRSKTVNVLGALELPNLQRHFESPRYRIYRDHLSILRVIMMQKMAKPEEVIIIENEHGEVVREIVKDTESISLYITMKETLTDLTKLDPIDMEIKMTDNLRSQMEDAAFTWKKFNCLCWAIGSISGAMDLESEKRFIIQVIRELLTLCEVRKEKEEKAIIASNLMYIVGQYPRFLAAHWNFLKAVVRKLFEFMHESFDGVQDMACDTFIKIVLRCKLEFIKLQYREEQTFADEIADEFQEIICDLEPRQVCIFYEAFGHIISILPEDEKTEHYIKQLMHPVNAAWEKFIIDVANDISILNSETKLKECLNILRVNTAISKSSRSCYFHQLQGVYQDFLSLYRMLSENLSHAVQASGEDVLRTPIGRLVRLIKREILIIVSTYVSFAIDRDLVRDHVVPPLFEAVLFDYQKNVPSAREPKVLTLISVIATRLKREIASNIPQILSSVFESTLDMINKDHLEFPEHRENFFRLLNVLMDSCFDEIISMPPEQLRLIIETIIWAIQHPTRNISEIGLEILRDVMIRVPFIEEQKAEQFYRDHYMHLVQHIFSALGDSNLVQVAGLSCYAQAMCSLFRAAEVHIKIPLNADNPSQSNLDFIFTVVSNMFRQHLPNLTEDQIRVLAKGFFSYNQDPAGMSDHLRDFLIQVKEIRGEDIADLCLEQRENEINDAQKKKINANVYALINSDDDF